MALERPVLGPPERGTLFYGIILSYNVEIVVGNCSHGSDIKCRSRGRLRSSKRHQMEQLNLAAGKTWLEVMDVISHATPNYILATGHDQYALRYWGVLVRKVVRYAYLPFLVHGNKMTTTDYPGQCTLNCVCIGTRQRIKHNHQFAFASQDTAMRHSEEILTDHGVEAFSSAR